MEIFSRSNEEEFDYNDSNDHQDNSIDHHDYDYKEHSKTLDYDIKDHRKTQDYDYKEHSKTLDYNYKEHIKALDYDYKEHSKTQDYDKKDPSKTRDNDNKGHSKTRDNDNKGHSKTQDYNYKGHIKTHDNKDLNDIPTNMKILNQIKSSRIKKLENPFGKTEIIKDDSLEMNRRDVNEEQLGVDALEKHDPLDLVQIMALKRHIAVAKSHSTSNLDFRHNSQIFMIFIFILYA